MFSIEKCPVPADTLLHKYTRNGSYTDCYSTEVPTQIFFPEYIFAFYTTPLFKLERLILRLTVSKPSTDLQARQLADGASDRFAAWHVEGRGENENAHPNRPRGVWERGTRWRLGSSIQAAGTKV